MYKRGDWVVYRMQKYSGRPGPRATQVEPEPHGEKYVYHVEKFWTVADVLPDGQLVLVTRRGKRHVLRADDPQLRPARWWERLTYRSRFPALQDEA